MELKQFVLISALLSASQSVRQDSNKAGLIYLHGLGIPWGPDAFSPLGLRIPGSPDKFCDAAAKSNLGGLGLSQNTIVRCPTAKRRYVGLLDQVFPPGLEYTPSWFNFWKFPAEAVVSTTPAEDREELMDSLQMVEEEIEELMALGVPSENIVVSGKSQGGALTLWTAIHSRYKLGGFVPIVAWLPLANVEPPTNLQFQPVNKDTPILHMAGAKDRLVPVTPATTTTVRAMKQVFSDYTFKTIPLMNHFTTAPNPVTMPILRKWLEENTNLKFKRDFNPFGRIIGTLNTLSNKNPLDILNSLVSKNALGDLHPVGGWGRKYY